MTTEYRGFASWDEWSKARRELEIAIENTTLGSREWRKRMEDLLKFDAEHPDK